MHRCAPSLMSDASTAVIDLPQGIAAQARISNSTVCNTRDKVPVRISRAGSHAREARNPMGANRCWNSLAAGLCGSAAHSGLMFLKFLDGPASRPFTLTKICSKD